MKWMPSSIKLSSSFLHPRFSERGRVTPFLSPKEVSQVTWLTKVMVSQVV